MLHIFDVDGTLCSWDSNIIYPNVEKWLESNKPADIALVSNQGFVGLRIWMEEGEWGEPAKYPTEQEAISRLEVIAGSVAGLTGGKVSIYYCFRFKSKKGNWAPPPQDIEDDEYVPEWSKFWRLPNTGMLITAMKDTGVSQKDAIMVSAGEDGQKAADAVGVQFSWAKEFFQEVKV